MDICAYEVLLRSVPFLFRYLHFLEGGQDFGAADDQMALFEVAGIAPPGGRLLLYLQLVLVIIIIGPLLVQLGILWVGRAGGG